MTYPISLPDSVEKLVLYCDCPVTRMSSGLKLLEVGERRANAIELPDSLEERRWRINKAVTLPAQGGLKKVYFEYGLFYLKL